MTAISLGTVMDFSHFLQVTNNSDVWKLYSDLYLAGDSKEEKEKVRRERMPVRVRACVRACDETLHCKQSTSRVVPIPFQALHFLVKAHRVRTQTPGWENDVSQFKGVIQLTLHLSEGNDTLLFVTGEYPFH